MMSASMDGDLGTSAFSDDELKFLRPKMVEVNQLCHDAHSTAEHEEAMSKSLLIELHAALSKRFDIPKKLVLKDMQ